MKSDWTIGQRIGAGFAVVVALSVVLAIVCARALDDVVSSKDRVITLNAQMIRHAEKLRAEREGKSGAARGFLLTREEQYATEAKRERAAFVATLGVLRGLADTEETRRLLSAIERAETEYSVAVENVIALRRTDSSIDVVSRAFTEHVTPKRNVLEDRIRGFIEYQERILTDSSRAAGEAASQAKFLVLGIGAMVILLSGVLAYTMTRALSTQIGSAVGLVQSSSSELQAAASQQASGAKEQATAMNEITTTISELLATSRQIAESARRVAQIAEQTAVAAQAGEDTVDGGHDAIATIRRQVDLIVSQILDVGKRSQHIGAVLDIVSELAEQTNILAINATIEAAGAGEAGKRFAVVADEIRKLADRVTASTKEIRGMIDDVRGAVNAAVMTTESGSKAVDAGSKQFSEVAASFKQIAGLVATTTEAAREIELSTKQQSTAVEQVNIAIANVAQASRETEASSGQTLQTASELSGLSRALLRLVQAQPARA